MLFDWKLCIPLSTEDSKKLTLCQYFVLNEGNNKFTNENCVICFELVKDNDLNAELCLMFNLK